MKNFKYLLVGILMIGVLTLTGCGKGSNNNGSSSTKSNFTGNATETLNAVKKEAMSYDEKEEYPLKDLGVSLNKVNGDNVKDILGIEEKELKEKIDDVIEEKPTDDWQTYSFVIVKAKDGVDVKALAEKITKNTKPDRFGCLKPEKIIGGYSGNYIIMVAADSKYAENIYKAFDKLSGGSTRIDRENDWSNSDIFGDGSAK